MTAINNHMCVDTIIMIQPATKSDAGGVKLAPTLRLKANLILIKPSLVSSWTNALISMGFTK
jgi:hypothetical protein